MLRDLMDLHHSNQNNEMNRVMKTLTVVSAIFIPLTFLAGVYGMNFHYMPELDSRWGYPLTVGVMLTVATFLGYYMRRKKWF
jgi:magnesium transporter